MVLKYGEGPQTIYLLNKVAMTLTKNILSLIVLMGCINSTALAQEATFQELKPPIEASLQQILDSSFTVRMILPFNDYVGTHEVTTYPLDDPYGTLKDHLLFGAHTYGTDSPYWKFGLFAGSQVVWVSPEDLECSDIQVYGSMDLNLDGTVDIVVNCALFGRNNFRGFLYIYSWDGSEGELISHTTINEYGYQINHIESYEATSFGILDLDGDGIMELEGLDPQSSEQRKYWSWNGQAYGNWPSTPLPPSTAFYPADMAEGRLETFITQIDSGYTYHYTVYNNLDSKRRISEVQIEHGKRETSGIAPAGWVFGGAAISYYPINWYYHFENTRYMINQGDSLAGMELYSTTPPWPYPYYLRSEYQLPNLYIDYSLDDYFYDVKTNSYKGITLAPGPDLDSLGIGVEAYADSLHSWTSFACDTTWANDEDVCNVLQSSATQIYDYLMTQDTLQAAIALQDFIDLVQAEENKSLTSEGYALLYYNAQYLAAQLPEPKTGSGITCGCDNPVTQSSGTITIRNGETKCLKTSFSGSVFFESGGTLSVCSVASLQNIYGNQPGHINVSETGEVSVGNWNNNYSEDSFTNWGTTTFNNWTTVNNGALTNYGEIEVNGGLNQNNGSITNHGQLTVSNDLNINTTGSTNSGFLSVGGRFTLNNGSFDNECRMQAGSFMLNGSLESAAGSSISSSGILTINSNGELSLGGNKAMLSVGGTMLNGKIYSIDENLFVSQNTVNFNSGALINSTGQPLYVVAPNFNILAQNFTVAEGSLVVVPATSCNPQGYNTGN